ncbi:hypothetical protein GCM10020227_35130 [Streptomyces flavovirens]
MVAPGFSFCVHHAALQLRPWWETVPPAGYAVVALQSGAQGDASPEGAAAAAPAAPGRKAAVATTALRTVRNLLMRFSAAHSFGAARRAPQRADLTCRPLNPCWSGPVKV